MLVFRKAYIFLAFRRLIIVFQHSPLLYAANAHCNHAFVFDIFSLGHTVLAGKEVTVGAFDAFAEDQTKRGEATDAVFLVESLLP